MADEQAHAPLVRRLQAGATTEGPGQRTWRSRGTGDWLLINTVAGQGYAGLAAGGAVQLGPGDLLLYRPSVPHDYGTADGTQAWALQFAHFNPRPDWLSLLDWPGHDTGVGLLRTSGEVHRRITECLARAVSLSRSGLAAAEMFGYNALEAALLWCSTQTARTAGLDPRLLGVLDDIAARLAEPLTVASLARRAGLSSSRLSHLFAQQLEASPMRFVERQRMQAAQELLELTSRSVAQVAHAVGVPDAYYFSTRFKRFSGLSPSAYRSRARSG